MPRLLIADITGALLGAVEILAALVARGRTSHGARIDISLFDAARLWLPFLDPPRLNGELACYNLYETADARWVALGALEPKFWSRFCRHVGREEWIALQFSPEPARTTLLEGVRALFRSRTAASWNESLAPIDCCFSQVNAP